MMDANTVKKITLSLIIVVGVAYLIYSNRHRLLWRYLPVQDKTPNRNEDAIKDVCRSFLMYADNFQGLYEPMFKASIGDISEERKRNVLMEWDIRMSNIGKVPVCLKSWWSTIIEGIINCSDQELQDRAKRILQMVRLSGIIRDEQTELSAARDTSMYYQHHNGIMWNIGQTLRVESPCWFMQTTPVRIIEKGYCEII